MPTFELRFSTFFDMGAGWKKKHANVVSRFIVARDFTEAQKIGKAMLGEEIWAHEWLAVFLSVNAAIEKTEDEQRYWDDGTITWRRVFQALGIEESDVNFIRNSRNFIVGFRGCAIS